MNKIKYFFVLQVFIILAIGSGGCSSRAGGGIKQVCFYTECVKVEVAATPDERAKGLQYRQSMGRDEGMLFIFPSSAHQSFWMKDTLIPLDIIWFDARKRIVFFLSNVLPCETDQCPVYTPDSNARYVLEVNAGVVAELGLSVGDQAFF